MTERSMTIGSPYAGDNGVSYRQECQDGKGVWVVLRLGTSGGQDVGGCFVEVLQKGTSHRYQLPGGLYGQHLPSALHHNGSNRSNVEGAKRAAISVMDTRRPSDRPLRCTTPRHAPDLPVGLLAVFAAKTAVAVVP